MGSAIPDGAKALNRRMGPLRTGRLGARAATGSELDEGEWH